MRIKKIDLPSIFSLLAASYHRILAVTFILFYLEIWQTWDYFFKKILCTGQNQSFQFENL
jgi:hypothetical protein